MNSIHFALFCQRRLPLSEIAIWRLIKGWCITLTLFSGWQLNNSDSFSGVEILLNWKFQLQVMNRWQKAWKDSQLQLEKLDIYFSSAICSFEKYCNFQRNGVLAFYISRSCIIESIRIIIWNRMSKVQTHRRNVNQYNNNNGSFAKFFTNEHNHRDSNCICAWFSIEQNVMKLLKKSIFGNFLNSIFCITFWPACIKLPEQYEESIRVDPIQQETRITESGKLPWRKK